MKNRVFTVVATMLLMPMVLFGQTYQSLWKQVREAEDKDLPQSAMKHVAAIEEKARKEKAYGQFIKATLTLSRLQSEVAPDSLKPAVDRLVKEEQAEKDIVLRSVYDAVLSQLYAQNRQLDDNWEAISEGYRTKALAHPDELGKVKDDSYEPFVQSGKSSEVFDHDLLSVIGMELNAWEWMNSYYERTGNRRASCLTALAILKKTAKPREEKLAECDYIRRLDSLINQYQDLAEAGEIAMERYSHMEEFTDASAAQCMEYLDMAIARWHAWKRVNQLRNKRQQLISTKFSASIPTSVQLPGKSQTVQLTGLRHLTSLTMKVYSTKLEGDTDINPIYDSDYKKIKDQLVEVKEASKTVTFRPYEPYEVFRDSLELVGLPLGVYLLEFSTNPSTSVDRRLYFVSDLRVMAIGQPESRMRYVVVDAAKGQPVKGATVRVRPNYYKSEKNRATLTTNAKGEANFTLDGNAQHYAYAYTSKDRYCPELRANEDFHFYDSNYRREHTEIFTDRAIYRPGQTVHMAAIIYATENHIETSVIEGRTLTAQLRDTNYKVVAEQKVVTDQFGKCSADFTLPTGVGNGRFSISLNGDNHYFSVEEYKRPTFEVSFEDYKESYKAGDTITVQGKAVSYAGVPVQEATVKYKVSRRIAYWWMSYSWYWGVGYYGHGNRDTELLTGETKTKDDGTFDVEVPMVLPDDDDPRFPMFYSFVIEADVTDQAGETHSGSDSMPLGTKPTVLTCDIPQRVRRDQIKPVTFHRRNAAGAEIDGKVRYRLDGGEWKECAANTDVAVLNAQLPAGEHRIEAACEGDSVEVKSILFGLDDKVPAIDTRDWFYQSDSRFPNDGKAVTIQVGASDPDLYIAYEIISNDRIIEEGFIRENRSLWNRKFTYKEEYGNGLLLTFAWVKDGKSYQHTATIQRPMPNKSLTMKWETFRDRLKPGQQEEWRLSVVDQDGKPADAQLMAVLYDKSLDQLKYHYWSLYPSMSVPLPSTSWRMLAFGSLSFSGSGGYDREYVPDFSYSHFDTDCYPTFYSPYHRGRFMGGRVLMKGAGAVNNGMVMEEAAPMMLESKAAVADAEEPVVVGYGVLKKDTAAEGSQGEKEDADLLDEESVQLRENLNETAFFYPALRTDSTGNVTLSFTLPESLTTWRFMGVAHTQDVKVGRLSGETIAQKDVMIQPNMPRFIRMGDEAQLSARIFNISDQPQQGTARLQLIDPETEKVVFTDQQPVALEAGKTGHVTFKYQPGIDYSLLICKMMVVGDSFSDGEQHYLPILPDREYVTKSVPFTQHEPGVKAIDLTKLFPAGVSQQKLTVEYTNNPAWLMVQSLSALGQPYETSAIDQAASYYSNLLAKTILGQSPNVKNVFEQWKRETGSEQTLQSSLEKNQELKNIVLAETPWVNAADREKEQKQRLSDFFDVNTIDTRLSNALKKLGDLQSGDGSFSWYPGMLPSPYITMSISEMLARLNVMTGSYGTASNIQSKAMKYLGKEIVELVEEMKRMEKKGYKPSFPSFTALKWLYICAIDKRELPRDVQSANDYLIRLMKKDIKNQTIYEKAMSAIILNHHGETKRAREYVQSLKEYTVYTEEMGRYYDTRRASYSWYSYKIPTEVAAIEAIKHVTPADEQTIDEMRRWLLQEKRTQMWDTPISSVNAIYAFLFDHANLLATQEPTVLAIDQQPIELPKATAGVGYVKTAIQEPKGREFTATKTSEGTSWGAVYAQFLQKTSEVEESKSGISVKRELLVPGTRVPTPVTSLRVGDRVKVRITIETTRDIDFVQVLDRRAACMEPVRQLSGYHNGAYVSPKDFSTNYYYRGLAKGKHVIETEYYIDRAGRYETGTCTVQCAYSPEYRATAKSQTLTVNP